MNTDEPTPAVLDTATPPSDEADETDIAQAAIGLVTVMDGLGNTY